MDTENLPGQTPAGQQPKPDPKGKAIASSVLGIISVIPLTLLIKIISYSQSFKDPEFAYAGFMLGIIGFLTAFVGIPLGGVAGFIGLILGIKGLKSSLKSLAIIGIILCIIGLLTAMLYLLVFILFLK